MVKLDIMKNAKISLLQKNSVLQVSNENYCWFNEKIWL